MKLKLVKAKRVNVYRLDDEELLKLLMAMVYPKVVRLDGSPIYSDRERCNSVWRKVATKRGLAWETITPVQGMGNEYFTAEKKELKMRNCTVGELRQMVSDKVFNKDIKPTAFKSNGAPVKLSNWVDLSKEFVKWLRISGALNDSKLPILNYAARDKFFINRVPSHGGSGRNGSWIEVSGVHVDTKYNAESHVKNILTALDQLGIYNPNIEISFDYS